MLLKPAAVTEQLRPGYDQVGFRSGSFIFLPYVLSTVNFDDNVYSTRQKTSDVVFRVAPVLQMKSDWSRNSLDGEIGVEGVKYVNQQKLDHINAHAGGVGKFELGSNSNVVVESRFVRSGDSMPLTGLPSQDGPIVSNAWSDALTLNAKANRFLFSAGVNWSYTNYENAKSFGVPVDQSYRNGYILNYVGRVGYEISPSSNVFFQPSYNIRRYKNSASNSDGYRLFAGASTELSRLVVGEVYGGYLYQNFKSPLIPTANSYGFGGRVMWYPTQLLTVTGSISRDIGDPSATGTTPPVATSFSLQTDYSTYHNILWSTQGSYTQSKYTAPSYYDYMYTASTGLTYFFNRWMQGTISVQRQWRENASVANNNYNRDLFTIGVKGTF